MTAKTKRGGLGPALDQWQESLRRQAEEPVQDAIEPIVELPVDRLQPAPWNARRYFDPDSLRTLGEDIRENGLIHAIVVRQVGERFEVVVGERRYRSAKTVGLRTIRAHVRHLNDRDARRMGLSENLERIDLNPYEETVGWLDLLGLELETVPDFLAAMRDGEALQDAVVRVLRRYAKERNSDHNVVVRNDARGRRAEFSVTGTPIEDAIVHTFQNTSRMTWQSFTKHRLPLLALPTDLLEALYTGRLEYTKAKELARVTDREQRTTLLTTVAELNLPLSQIKDRVRDLLSPAAPPLAGDTDLASNYHRVARRVRHVEPTLDPARRARLAELLEEIDRLLG